eukprot:1913306-Rhodomonas_salina.1
MLEKLFTNCVRRDEERFWVDQSVGQPGSELGKEGGSGPRDGGEGRAQNVAAGCGIWQCDTLASSGHASRCSNAQHARLFGCQMGMLAAAEICNCWVPRRKRTMWSGRGSRLVAGGVLRVDACGDLLTGWIQSACPWSVRRHSVQARAEETARAQPVEREEQREGD